MEELSIGGNQLKFLPAELKEISSLKILVGDPNPYLTPTQVKDLNEENMKLFCGQSDDAEGREGMDRLFFPCPSLKELASRDWLTEQRSHYFISPSLLMLPNHLAADLHTQSTYCSQCKKIIYNHFLRHYKMETLTCSNNGQSVPFEYIICSLECLFTMK